MFKLKYSGYLISSIRSEFDNSFNDKQSSTMKLWYVRLFTVNKCTKLVL